MIVLVAIAATRFHFHDDVESVDSVAARDAFRMSQLMDEHGAIPADGWEKALKIKNEMPDNPGAWSEFNDPSTGQTFPWRTLGPGNVGGRIRSIVTYPENPNKVWCAGVGGGPWVSFNGGIHWYSNANFLANLNVSCMVGDPKKEDTVYYGTGGETLTGNGIFKSTDEGQHWKQLESTANNPLFRTVVRMAISPNSKWMLSCSDYGIFRSTDEGTTWSPTVGASQQIYDLHYHPTDDNKAIASGRWGNVYYSEDGGKTWNESEWIIRPPGIGTTRLAYAKADPDTVYANTQANGGQLYRSWSGGKSFRPVGVCCTTAVYYANVVWANDPTSADKVVYGGTTLFRSQNGGLSRDNVGAGHEDNQVIVEDPGYNGTSNRTVYLGNDGGMWKTDNLMKVPVPLPSPGNSMVQWTNMNHNLGVTQFLGAAGNAVSGTYVGGTQDNGTTTLFGGYDSESWHGLNFGDGGFCASDPNDPNYFYAEQPYLDISRSTNGGKSFQPIIWNMPHGCGNVCANFTAPFIIDPNDSNTLLAGGTSLWKTGNVKEEDSHNITWREIKAPVASNSYISAISVPRGNPQLIWVGYADGEVWNTSNGGSSWTQVTGLPARFCTHIDVAPGPNVYVTFGGFTSGNIWRYNDGLWRDISAGLPQMPIYTVTHSPIHPDNIYVGTELGVDASSDRGGTWASTNDGPANVAVFVLFWMGQGTPRELTAATFGRGMFAVGPTSH